MSRQEIESLLQTKEEREEWIRQGMPLDLDRVAVIVQQVRKHQLEKKRRKLAKQRRTIDL